MTSVVTSDGYTVLDVAVSSETTADESVDGVSAEVEPFSDDPSRTKAAVVGVSPEFELEPIVGAHVIDLERRTVSDVQPSDNSMALVDAFLGGVPVPDRRRSRAGRFGRSKEA